MVHMLQNMQSSFTHVISTFWGHALACNIYIYILILISRFISWPDISWILITNMLALLLTSYSLTLAMIRMANELYNIIICNMYVHTHTYTQEAVFYIIFCCCRGSSPYTFIDTLIIPESFQAGLKKCTGSLAPPVFCGAHKPDTWHSLTS